MGDPFRRYPSIFFFFLFHLLPMLHLKCCSVCLSFADTLAPLLFIQLWQEGLSPSSSSNSPSGSLLISGSSHRSSLSSSCGSFSSCSCGSSSLSSAGSFSFSASGSSFCSSSSSPSSSLSSDAQLISSFLANCLCSCCCSCRAGHCLCGYFHCCSCQRLLLLPKASAANTANNCCSYRRCCPCRVPLRIGTKFLYRLLLLVTAAAPADGCFSFWRLLLLLTAAAPMAAAPAGDCFSCLAGGSGWCCGSCCSLPQLIFFFPTRPSFSSLPVPSSSHLLGVPASLRLLWLLLPLCMRCWAPPLLPMSQNTAWPMYPSPRNPCTTQGGGQLEGRGQLGQRVLVYLWPPLSMSGGQEGWPYSSPPLPGGEGGGGGGEGRWVEGGWQ